MDLFNRGKSKAKKKSDPPIIQTTPSPQHSNTTHSPKSPHPGDDYFTSGNLTKESDPIHIKSIFINPVQG